MDNNVHRIAYFLQKYLDKDIQKEEQSLLYHLLEESTEEEIQAAFDLVLKNTPLPDDNTTPLFSDVESASILRDIMENVPITYRKARWKRATAYALAACLVGALLTFAWLHLNREATSAEEAVIIGMQEMEHDVDPARDEAILLLEGGEKFSLQDIKAGDSVEMGDIKLVNIDGQLSYERKEGPGTQHVVQTPKGGQINMTLPDGTKVWLNADSRISFLSNLGATDREVAVTGEVYFEVAKLAGKRFTVKNGAGEIEVLGTKFNVRAYPEDKAMQTALVEGSLALKTDAERVLLKPNQIGVTAASQQIRITEHQDITNIIAWKNGLFLFDNTAMTDVGRQLGRWYNIDVQLGEGLGAKRITGKIERDVKLSQVLKMLHYLGIETTIKDNNLIMIPQKEKAYGETSKM